jgi:hypothetical protein
MVESDGWKRSRASLRYSKTFEYHQNTTQEDTVTLAVNVEIDDTRT